MYQPFRSYVCARVFLFMRHPPLCFPDVQGVEDIQLDMMTYGSVTAAFSVHSDFLTYSGGVYSNKSGVYVYSSWHLSKFPLNVCLGLIEAFHPIMQSSTSMSMVSVRQEPYICSPDLRIGSIYIHMR